MEWLVISALAAVAVWQGVLLGALNRRVAELEKQLRAREAGSAQVAPAPQPAPTAEPPAHEEEPLLLTEALPPEQEEPLLLDQPVADGELLLDTPLPEVSNDDEPLAPPPIAEPARIAEALPPPRPAKPPFRFDQWLAEKGFAWIAGSALALGAIYLVSFATQQQWFTPRVQLSLAVGLAVVLLGASEGARRVSLRDPPGHPLIAALLAGAGVVALYATSWAAHGLYNYIGFGGAAALLTLCALVLIGLSFLHGQAIGVLAIIMAMLAPALAHSPLWPPLAWPTYVAAVGAAGIALAAFRRWGWVTLATMSGLYFWFWTAVADNDIQYALMLLSFASFGAVAIALRPPLETSAQERLSWRQVHALGPTLGVAISSVFLIFVWAAVAARMAAPIAGPALIGVFHVALAAYAVRGRVATPPALIVAIGGLVGGCAAYLQVRFHVGPLSNDFYPVILAAAPGIVICAVGARPQRRWRIGTAATGALGAAALLILASWSREDWHAPAGWASLFGGALLLFIAAWRELRIGATARTQRAIDFWAGAGAALALLGIESAFPPEARAPAYAGASLLLASGFAQSGWRALRFAAITAGAITIVHALSPSLIGAALVGQIPIWGALIILTGAAAMLFGASHFATAEPRSPFGEGLSAAGVITILIGAFLLLRWFTTGADGQLDLFSEAALRVIALMAAGHIVMARPGQDVGLIGRWRGHALMGIGLLYTLYVPVISANPWWGTQPSQVIGPPLLDSLTLAFAAPAALALWAARRLYLHERTLARIYAICGGALALLWAVLEVRRAAHGEPMWGEPVGLLEGASYALLFLGAALAVGVFARLRGRTHDGPFTKDLMHAMRAVAWGALVASGLILLVARHPWWGAHFGGSTDNLQTGLALLAQAAAVALSLALGRALSVSRETDPARFAAATAALLFSWSFGHAAIRWLYHLGAMDDGAALIGLEGFAHTLWPLVFALLGAVVTARAPGRDTTRAYLYDLQALWASAVWPALGFAALGLWLLFNPWWGVNPAVIATPLSAAAALACLLLAAWLSIASLRVPRLRWPERFAHAGTLACIAHLLVAATLAVRWLHHGEAMSTASAGEVELWVYSAVWAVFGAATFWLALRREDALVRWSGLVILLLTTFYVYVLIFTQLTGFIRALTAIGLALVLFAVAWLARTYRPGPQPTDLLNVKPSARREKRYGRRQRSQ